MATTEVEICNLALFRVRAKEIGDLNEQTVNAEKCRVLYPQARDSLLTAVPWGFAKTDRALSLQATTPTEWDYGYDMPNDCLKARYIVPPGGSGTISQSGITLSNIEIDHIPFEILTGSNGSRTIATNYEDAVLAYTQAVTDVRLFDAVFEEALAWRLAMDLAIPLGGDSGKQYRAEAKNEYKLLLDEARASNANQAWPRKTQHRPREIQARSGSVYSHYHYNGQFYRRY